MRGHAFSSESADEQLSAVLRANTDAGRTCGKVALPPGTLVGRHRLCTHPSQGPGKVHPEFSLCSEWTFARHCIGSNFTVSLPRDAQVWVLL